MPVFNRLLHVLHRFYKEFFCLFKSFWIFLETFIVYWLHGQKFVLVVSDTACRKKSENFAVLGVVTLYWFHVSFNFEEPGGPSLPPAFMTDCHWTAGVHC